MLDSLLEIAYRVAEEQSIFDGVFGLDIIEPPLTREEWEAACFDENGLKYTTVEEMQTEYQEYLKGEMLRLRAEIDILLNEIDAIAQTANPELKAELMKLKHELYWATCDEDGKIIEEGGLRARLDEGLWILQNYNFYTKQLEYYIPVEGKEEWVEKISKMSPEEVLSEAYWPVSSRVAISLPELPAEQSRVA